MVNLTTDLTTLPKKYVLLHLLMEVLCLLIVDNKNTIKVVTIDNSKHSAIQNSIGEISSPLQYEFYIVKIKGKNVAVIEVPSGQNKPCVLSGAIYLRQGPNAQGLKTVEEMSDFFQQAEKIYLDEASCKEIDIKKDIPRENIDTFRFEAGLVKI